MKWGDLAWAIGKFLVLLFTALLEKNTDKKEVKLEILEEVKNGIQNKDPGLITAAFDRLNVLSKQ